MESEQSSKKSRKPYTMTRQRESWTNDEHERFIKALQLYNRDWKKIETYVGTKTVVQIRCGGRGGLGQGRARRQTRPPTAVAVRSNSDMMVCVWWCSLAGCQAVCRAACTNSSTTTCCAAHSLSAGAMRRSFSKRP